MADAINGGNMRNIPARPGHGLAKALSRLLRRIVPSVAPLTYYWPVKALLNGIDIPLRMIFPEFRRLPPNHLRVRIGVGWKYGNNHIYHLTHAEPFWMFALAKGYVTLESNILDLGIGCGRYAHHLRDFRFMGRGYTGTYVGIDIDDELLDWCRANFNAANFRFHLSSHRSAAFRSQGDGGYYVIPEPDGVFDFVYSTSLFTHLLEEQMENYLRETFRLLKPGSVMAAYCFCLDYPPPTYGGRHTFSHRMGNAFVESPDCPEAAVAYTEAFLFDCVRRAGFVAPEMIASPEDWQPMLVCRKPA